MKVLHEVCHCLVYISRQKRGHQSSNWLADDELELPGWLVEMASEWLYELLCTEKEEEQSS